MSGPAGQIHPMGERTRIKSLVRPSGVSGARRKQKVKAQMVVHTRQSGAQGHPGLPETVSTGELNQLYETLSGPLIF